MIGTILWAIIAGIILGYLGKLLLPGRQDIPAWATIAAGIVAALLGGFVAGWLGWANTPGIDWLKHGLQIIFAVIAIWAVTALIGVRSRRSGPHRA